MADQQKIIQLLKDGNVVGEVSIDTGSFPKHLLVSTFTDELYHPIDLIRVVTQGPGAAVGPELALLPGEEACFIGVPVLQILHQKPMLKIRNVALRCYLFEESDRAVFPLKGQFLVSQTSDPEYPEFYDFSRRFRLETLPP